jgi:glucosylceramidase
MTRRNVEGFFGTLERGDAGLLNMVLADPEAGRYIRRVGVQWAGNGAVSKIHKEHPALTIYQSEQECGDGNNDWKYAGYCWDLMKHYLRSGASGYMYWNIALKPGGESRWGWPQNSLITVDTDAKTYRWNHEYYAMKHASHFVQRGQGDCRRKEPSTMYWRFSIRTKIVVVILRNESGYERAVDVRIGDRQIAGSMEADSFNTLLLRWDG